MAKRQIRVFLEKEDIQTLQDAANKNLKSLSETCRNIIREKIISGAVDELSTRLMIEKRIEFMISNFEERLKEISRNYIKVPAQIPTDLLIKTTLYGRASWEVLKKGLTQEEKETIYRRSLASVKEAERTELETEKKFKPKIELGRKT
ncbi:MAG: hypothetical protein L6408_04320 [Nanoarchaeota archaeon]|nr:hypothetical protein [Nanoarchaeota archaeon]